MSGIKDVPNELLLEIARNLDMKDLNNLRLVSKQMRVIADAAAARDAKKIGAFMRSIQDEFKGEVVHRYNVASELFDNLKGWAGEVKASKSGTPKGEYKAEKAKVTKALVELGDFIEEMIAASAALSHRLDEIEKMISRDLQDLASASKEDRAEKRGGKSDLTYDECDQALAKIEQVRKGLATIGKQIAEQKKELDTFGKEFSKKYKGT
jgi:cell fate (sporulation/competence/biofilm development) regulator YlbF (YheA/YmcA/DUF963 family)